jgi:flagellin-like hook-associated protein FlgL
VGTLDQRLEVHERINEVQDIELERLRSTIEDTNFAEAAAEMSLRQTAYQASLAATARVQGLSLLNYMR